MTDLVLYADFGYPCCYLAGRAVDALSAAGVDVDWRAVRHERRATVGMRTPGADQPSLPDDEFAAVVHAVGVDSVPEVAAQTPNTRAAISGYAEAYECGVADDVRRVLLDAYWSRHLDIGDPEVLRTLLAGPILRGTSSSDPLRLFGFAVSANRDPVTTAAWRRIRHWRTEWEQAGAAALPTLAGDDDVISGPAAVLRRLSEEMIVRGARADRPLPEPGRYPKAGSRPAKQWVSQVGGPWRHEWMNHAG